MDNPVSRRAFVTWLEGVAVTAEGTIYFSDVLGDRIYRLDADACIPEIMREKANFPNGQVIDNDGRLITCEGGDSRSGAPPRVTRTDLRTGKSEVLFDRFEGRRLLGPNDVRIDHFGRLYVTDGQRPPFLPELQAEDLPAGYRAPVDTVGVYRLDTDGTVVRILAAPAVSQPNGLGVLADGKTLFINDNDAALGGRRRLVRFDLTDEGPGPPRVLHDFGVGRPGDGLLVDRAGDVLICAGLNRQWSEAMTADAPAGVYIFSPEGSPKGFVPIPEDNCTNLAELPGEPGRFLVTAGRTLYAFQKSETNRRPFPFSLKSQEFLGDQ